MLFCNNIIQNGSERAIGKAMSNSGLQEADDDDDFFYYEEWMLFKRFVFLIFNFDFTF